MYNYNSFHHKIPTSKYQTGSSWYLLSWLINTKFKIQCYSLQKCTVYAHVSSPKLLQVTKSGTGTLLNRTDTINTKLCLHIIPRATLNYGTEIWVLNKRES
jgi:hypothetical protein